MIRIPLLRSRQPTAWVAVADDSDAPLLAAYRWAIFMPRGSRTAYARCGDTYMHRLIMGHPPAANLELDHEDGDGLNNQRTNLRWLTHAANIQAAHDRASFAISDVSAFAARVHTVKARGRVYYYDRDTREKLTEAEAQERLQNAARTKAVKDGVKGSSRSA